MNLAARDERGVSVVSVSGAIEGMNSAILGHFLGQLVAAGRRKFVVDLTGVNFIDSSGLAALVSFLKRTKEGEGDVYLTGLEPAVRRVMDLTRLDRVFTIFPTLDDALAQMTAS